MISPQDSWAEHVQQKLHSFELNYHFSWLNHSSNDVRVSAQSV